MIRMSNDLKIRNPFPRRKRVSGEFWREVIIMAVNVVIEPLIRRRIFTTEEEAIRELMREYILKQIAALQRKISYFERKYGMRFIQ